MGPLKRTVLTRLGGDKPSPLRPAIAAAIGGSIETVITHKPLPS